MECKVVLFSFIILTVNACPEKRDEVFPGKCACIWSPVDKISHFSCSALETEQDLMQVAYSSSVINKIFEFTITDSMLNFIPSGAFEGLSLNEIRIYNSTIGALSDTDVAFSGLEDTLHVLYIENCTLMSFWDWSAIKYLRELTFITITEVGLETVEKVNQTFPEKLKYINLMHNKINFLHDEAFENCKNLSILKLDFNKISTLKRSMLPNPANNFRQITLMRNNIKSFPADIFSNMTALKFIDISFNEILTLEKEVFIPVWMQLDDFDFLGNELSCDCRLRWILKVPPPPWVRAECSQPNNLKGINVLRLTSQDLYC